MEQIKPLLDLIFKDRDSVFLVIDGFNQSGKTALMFLLMEGLHKHKFGFEFGLNQQVENAPFEYDYITDQQTLDQRIIALGKKKKYFYFLDELGRSAPRATPWGKINIELIKRMEVKRKSKLSFGGCSIGDIDRRIVSPNYLDVYIQKLGLTHARLHHLQKRYTTRINNIPNTIVKFPEFTEAEFTLTPKSTSDTFLDHDMKLALSWARKEKYQGELSKQGRFNSIRRGLLKWYDLYSLHLNTTKPVVTPEETVDKQ